MKLIREMSLVKDRVKYLLAAWPHLRNNDNKLIANIWNQDLLKMGHNNATLSASNFLALYATGQLSNAETIRRVRQKIQEENPELRGTAYSERQKQGEEVRKEIKESS